MKLSLKGKWCFTFLLCVVFFILVLQIMKNHQSKKSLITLWSTHAPFSTDPLEYDVISHHICFRSILSSVISQYHLGKYEGILAESWDPFDEYKGWKFVIRKDLHFENGDEITPDHIVRSWMRMAYLQKKKNSHNGFLELLDGFERITSPKSSIRGIQVKDQTITLYFTKPCKKLLETISFGLYSVIHPKNYDANTGEWKNPKKVISSGGYKIDSWGKESIKLKRREDFLPEIRHPQAPENVFITWDPEKKLDSDLISGGSNEKKLGTNRVFQGPVISNIAYVICASWTDANSICHNLENRVLLRNEFYKALIQDGIKPTFSFFPLTMANVRESLFKTENNTNFFTNSKKKFTLRYVHTWFKNPFFDPFDIAMEKIAKKLNLKPKKKNITQQQVQKEKDPLLKTQTFDVAMLGTGILIDDPMADIRFMFLSKEGIRLSDIDGSIHKELEQENFDPQKINELIWDQAVVWPVGHFSFGIWAKKHIDFSEINTVLPPIDFQWIGLKN